MPECNKYLGTPGLAIWIYPNRAGQSWRLVLYGKLGIRSLLHADHIAAIARPRTHPIGVNLLPHYCAACGDRQ